MKKRTIRTLLKWSLPLDVLLFAAVLLDYFFWDSTAMVPLLVALAALVLFLLLLLLLRDRAPYTRLPEAPDEGAKSVIYPRGPHG